MSDWSVIIAFAALAVSILIGLSKTLDKSLSIREHEAYKDAVSRDIERVEKRLSHIEQTRPTTGELQIMSDAFNKRLDELKRNNNC